MKQSIIILIFYIVFSSCKDTACPAFPEDLLLYYPYKKGDTIKFTNQNLDTLWLNVSNNSASESYSFAWNCKCACGTYAGFGTEIENIYSVKIEGNLGASNEENSADIECNFYDGEAVGGGTFRTSKEGLNPFLPENTKLFGDTIKMENEGFSRFNKVVIVYGKGIVEFWDKKQNCTWRKFE